MTRLDSSFVACILLSLDSGEGSSAKYEEVERASQHFETLVQLKEPRKGRERERERERDQEEMRFDERAGDFNQEIDTFHHCSLTSDKDKSDRVSSLDGCGRIKAVLFVILERPMHVFSTSFTWFSAAFRPASHDASSCAVRCPLA